MALQLPDKAPGDVLFVPIDYSQLLDVGEAIDSVVSTTESPTGTLTVTSLITDTQELTLLLQAGTELETYTITVLIETDQGSPARRYERTFCVNVKALP